MAVGTVAHTGAVVEIGVGWTGSAHVLVRTGLAGVGTSEASIDQIDSF